MFSIAKNESINIVNQLKNLVFGILDCSTLLLFLLPLFSQPSEHNVMSVPLRALTDINPTIHVLFILSVIAITIFGIATLALQNQESNKWINFKIPASIALTCVCSILCILASQPYPSIFMLAHLLIKGSILLNYR